MSFFSRTWIAAVLFAVLPAFSATEEDPRQEIESLLSEASGENEEHAHDHGHEHHHDHEHDHSHESANPDRLESLVSIQEVGRDGTTTVEQRFSLFVSGENIKRGPVLSFLTVFRGPGGLVLDKDFEVLELWRDGVPEPFRIELHEGGGKLYCGSKDVFLEPGTYDYVLRYRTDGGWKSRGGELIGEFDASGPFQNLSVAEARMIVRLPQGVKLGRYSPVVYGVDAPAPGYESEVKGGELLVSAAGPLAADHLFLVNAVWNDDGFVRPSLWSETLRQHPKVGLSLFSASLLLVALILLLRRIAISRPSPAAA